METLIRIIIVIVMFIFTLLFLGCTKDIQYVESTVDKIQLKAHEIQQPNLETFNVINTKINAENYSCTLIKNVPVIVKNIQEIKAYIKQQDDVIKYYESEIDKRNNSK